MYRLVRLLLPIFVLGLGLGLPDAPHAAPVDERASGEIPPAVAASPPPAPAAEPTRGGMVAELTAAIADARSRVDALARKARSARPAEAVALQREAERIKFESELTVLRIQVAWAKREGRTQTARALEAAIEERLHPPVLGDPETAVLRRADSK